MKKIGLVFCLLLILLTNVKADTSKDIMIKYEYTDKTSEITKEVTDNKVEYNLNEDKVKLELEGNTDNINILFFEVSKESLDWLKTKVNINENSNVYYLKFLVEKDNELNVTVTVDEMSGENKVVKIYDKNGNELQKAVNNCYVVIEKVNEEQVKIDEEEVDKDNVTLTNPQKTESNISPLIIFIIVLTAIFIILIFIVRTRKDKDNG